MTQIAEEQLSKVNTTLATMIDYLGLEASIKAEERGTKIVANIVSEDAGRIIGRKGQSLENLQLLINRMMQKTDPDFPRIILDIDGYSAGKSRADGSRGERGDRGGERGERGDRGDRGGRRGGRGGRGDRRRGGDRHEGGEGRPRRQEVDEETLKQQAVDAAKEVRRWGESVTLPPMNSHDRRIIHVTLQEEEDIDTESVGEGTRKSVTVSLKK